MRMVLTPSVGTPQVPLLILENDFVPSGAICQAQMGRKEASRCREAGPKW